MQKRVGKGSSSPKNGFQDFDVLHSKSSIVLLSRQEATLPHPSFHQL